MKQKIHDLIKNETFIAGLLIFLTVVITYGIRMANLGYYYDDWYLLWSGRARGAESIIPLFSTDRPYMGVVYSLVYRLLGDTIINWHLYALLWRLIGGLAFFWILRLIWPQEKYMTALMAVLFVIYPGFLSQPDANTKQNHLFGFGSALLSIALMLQALKTDTWIGRFFYVGISVLLTANYLFIYEYMIGLEGMRLLFLGLALFQNGFRQVRALLQEIIRHWWPYPAVIAGFLFWRLFIFDSSRNATDSDQLLFSYRVDLADMSLRLLFETLKDFLDTVLFAWFVAPFHLIANARYTDLLMALLFAAAVAGLVWLYSVLFKKWWGDEFHEADTAMLARNFLWIGAFITLCAILPVVLSARDYNPADAYKSYGLHPIGGVVILIAGIILMFQPAFRKPGLVALIGISVCSQLLNTINWERSWQHQRDAWWQLSWRAPDIRNKTMVIAYFSAGFALQQDYEIWGPVNLIYRQEPANFPLIQAEVLNEATAFNIEQGDILGKRVRDMPMRRDFTKVLLISLPSENSCIHVIDGTLPIYSEYESDLIRRLGSYSIIQRITTDSEAPVPPAVIFQGEPPHDWCFYYQKASLARQMGDWNEIGRLYDETLTRELVAGDKSEVFPFLEGLVNSGRYDDAKALYEKEILERDNLNHDLCSALATDPGYPPEFNYDYVRLHQILCEP
jgi:hypothetical protein